MKKPADLFLARLHTEVTKPNGFKKIARTFSREHAEYSEHYNIQGSAWNSSETPWTFYVNCAISFPQVALRSDGIGLWKYHAHARLRHLVKDAPDQFEVTEATCDQMVEQVGGYLMRCSEYFRRRHKILRDSYIREDFYSGFLGDPELKKEG